MFPLEGSVARREPYSNLRKRGQQRPAHVEGQGDTVFKVFQCLSPECQAWIAVRRADVQSGFQLQCSSCSYELRDGGITHLFDYDLLVEKEVVESAEFTIDHGEYVRGAPDYKYCILCCAMKPLDAFGRHASRPESGRQGECRSCKTTYNSIKNKTRIPDQHREASQRRRLFGLLANDAPPVNLEEIREKFEHKCFSCGVSITKENEALDHTLPVRLLWPLTTESATLLCKACNGQKSAQWPSEFYNEQHLRRLAVLTGIHYAILAGQPTVNQQALDMIQSDTDAFITAWIDRPEDLKALRRLMKEVADIDILENATIVPGYLC